ncbi:hypothetical protein PANDA_019548 [Ailuropoda melanoleuca]|uniref:Uncharacterized protein n=1 Tax=Ailuropoda melanoleuca TaxID=9646 RepID=D2I2D5_AILME|nr:hypothetical protein PANDA_019548 [Ailuropoda melanoleuca]
MAKAEEPTGPKALAGRLLKATPSTLANGGAVGLFTGPCRRIPKEGLRGLRLELEGGSLPDPDQEQAAAGLVQSSPGRSSGSWALCPGWIVGTVCAEWVVGGVCLGWIVGTVRPEWVVGAVCPGWIVGTVCAEWVVGGVCLGWIVGTVRPEWVVGAVCPGWIVGTVCAEWVVGAVCPGWIVGTVCAEWVVGAVCPEWVVGAACPEWVVGAVCPGWIVGTVCPEWVVGAACPEWVVGAVCPEWVMGAVCPGWIVGSSRPEVITSAKAVLPVTSAQPVPVSAVTAGLEGSLSVSVFRSLPVAQQVLRGEGEAPAGPALHSTAAQAEGPLGFRGVSWSCRSMESWAQTQHRALSTQPGRR